MRNLLENKAWSPSRLKWILLLAVVAVFLGLLFLRPPTESKEGDLSMGLLGGSCLALVGLMWWRKKALKRDVRGAGRMEWIEKIRLEPGCHLHLVEVDGDRLVLTNAAQGLRLITRLGTKSRLDENRENL
jgi:hypothetical protein